MSKSKQMVLEYLEPNSDEQKAARKFIKKLSEMVERSGNGDYLKGSLKFNEDFEDLFGIVENIKTDFVPYSEITRIIYTCDNIDGIDTFFLKFSEELSKSINKSTPNGEDITDGYIILIKALEHMKLANKQVESLYKKQNKEIQEQREKINKQNKEIQEQREKINKQNNNLTEIESKLQAQNKKLESNQLALKNVENTKGTIYSEFTTILGIFTAITFATFGGLQLLGNVFGNIKNVTHISIGSTIMLGSIYLIGIYLILVALLTGVAKLGNKKYIVSFPMRDALLGAFITMFLFGFAYSNYHFLIYFVDKMPFNYFWSACLIMTFSLICVILPGLLDVLIYRKFSNNVKEDTDNKSK